MTPLSAFFWPTFQASAARMENSSRESPSSEGMVRIATWVESVFSSSASSVSSWRSTAGEIMSAKSLTLPLNAGTSRARAVVDSTRISAALNCAISGLRTSGPPLGFVAEVDCGRGLGAGISLEEFLALQMQHHGVSQGVREAANRIVEGLDRVVVTLTGYTLMRFSVPSSWCCRPRKFWLALRSG